MRDDGGSQRDSKTKIGEFFYFKRDRGYQEREQAQCFGSGEFYLKIAGQAQVLEGAFGIDEMVKKREANDTEQHNESYYACGGPIDDPVFFHSFCT